MKDFEEKFINELGNEITISLSLDIDQPYADKTSMHTIRIAGPKSEVTLTMTALEIEMLFDQFYLHR